MPAHDPRRTRDPRSVHLALVGVIACGASIPAGLLAFVWAAFFSVGFKTSSTSSMIRYNLRDPWLALFAYGPLLTAVLVFVFGVTLIVRGLLLRRRDQ